MNQADIDVESTSSPRCRSTVRPGFHRGIGTSEAEKQQADHQGDQAAEPVATRALNPAATFRMPIAR